MVIEVLFTGNEEDEMVVSLGGYDLLSHLSGISKVAKEADLRYK